MIHMKRLKKLMIALVAVVVFCVASFVTVDALLRRGNTSKEVSGGNVYGDGELLEEGKVHAMPTKLLFTGEPRTGSNGSNNGSVRITATVSPSNASNKNVWWDLEFPEFTQWSGQDLPSGQTWRDYNPRDYVTVTPDENDTRIATVTFIRSFGAPILLTCTSQADASISATCTIGCYQYIETIELGFDLGFTDLSYVEDGGSIVRGLTYHSSFSQGTPMSNLLNGNETLGGGMTYSNFTTYSGTSFSLWFGIEWKSSFLTAFSAYLTANGHGEMMSYFGTTHKREYSSYGRGAYSDTMFRIPAFNDFYGICMINSDFFDIDDATDEEYDEFYTLLVDYFRAQRDPVPVFKVEVGIEPSNRNLARLGKKIEFTSLILGTQCEQLASVPVSQLDLNNTQLYFPIGG